MNLPWRHGAPWSSTLMKGIPSMEHQVTNGNIPSKLATIAWCFWQGHLMSRSKFLNTRSILDHGRWGFWTIWVTMLQKSNVKSRCTWPKSQQLRRQIVINSLDGMKEKNPTLLTCHFSSLIPWKMFSFFLSFHFPCFLELWRDSYEKERQCGELAGTTYNSLPTQNNFLPKLIANYQH